MTMCTVLPAHEIIHACWMALAKAAPERACAGWGKITHCNMAAPRPRARPMSCTIGARCRGRRRHGRDGFEQIGPLNSLGKLIVPNCETYEQLYPVRFLQHELRCDAAGPGEFRGGAAPPIASSSRRKLIRLSRRGPADAIGLRSPWRRDGRGRTSRVPRRRGLVDATAVRRRPVGPTEITIDSPAGGGWGDPKERAANLVLLDVRNGIVSKDGTLGVRRGAHRGRAVRGRRGDPRFTRRMRS